MTLNRDRADQLDTLMAARDGEPDTGFVMRLLAQCILARTNPGTRDRYVRMRRLAAIVVVVISSSLPAFAEEPHARFEFMAGVTPFGCSEGCGVAATPPFVDVGATGWTSGGVGLSMKVRDVFGEVYGIFLEPSLRLRGFVGEHGDREIDFGVGWGVFPTGQYNHAWTVGMSVGFRTHEHVGLRVRR